jgi:hypothetical protein
MQEVSICSVRPGGSGSLEAEVISMLVRFGRLGVSATRRKRANAHALDDGQATPREAARPLPVFDVRPQDPPLFLSDRTRS